MSRRGKWTLGVVGLLVAGGIAAGVVIGTRKKVVAVRIEPVLRRDLVASVTASGQVEPHTKVQLSADISGRIVQLAVKEGDTVAKGQFLLQIDPATYQAAVDRAQAALAGARAQVVQASANLEQAQRTYDRSAEIKKANPALVSSEQLEQLRTQVDVDKAVLQAGAFNVDQSLAAVRDAQSTLSKTTIRAPMAGRVTRLVVENGETAIEGTLNKEAATLLTISDMRVLETKIKVDETDVAHIAIGDSAIVQIDAFPDTTFVGRVTKISNSSLKTAAEAVSNSGPTTDQAINYEVTVQLLNAPPDTRPDYSATDRIVTDTRMNVLSIPIIALTVREHEKLPSADTAVTLARRSPTKKRVGLQDAEGVFVVDPKNTVAFRPVKVGIAGDEYFEVLSGLQSGERIVGGPYQAIRDLKDGAKVKLKTDSTADSTS
jgi:HlyD family secretion protein